MDLTPKPSTPWWYLLHCCRRTPLNQADDDDETESNVDNLQQPVTKCTKIPATIPIEKCTPPPTTPMYEDSQCSLILDEGPEEVLDENLNNTYDFTDDVKLPKKIDYTSGIGMFLTLAAAARVSNIKNADHSFEKRRLFGESFDLKEVDVLI